MQLSKAIKVNVVGEDTAKEDLVASYDLRDYLHLVGYYKLEELIIEGLEVDLEEAFKGCFSYDELHCYNWRTLRSEVGETPPDDVLVDEDTAKENKIVLVPTAAIPKMLYPPSYIGSIGSRCHLPFGDKTLLTKRQKGSSSEEKSYEGVSR